MKFNRKSIALIVSSIMACGINPLLAEDIDLYVAGSPVQNAPNVLMMLDNTSNWASAGWRRNTQGQNTGAWEACAGDTVCQGYVNQIFGTSPSSTLAQGQVEAAVIKLVFNELICNPPSGAKTIDVNVGLEFMAPDKGANGVTSIGAAYIRRPVLPLKKGNGDGNSTCEMIIADLDQIIGDINSPAFKTASSATYAELFFEAFKYFGGYTNPANRFNDSPTVPNDGQGTPTARDAFGPNRYTDHTQYSEPGVFIDDSATTKGTTRLTYKSPINSDNNCGKNYIILIGNNVPNGDASGAFLFDSNHLKYPYDRAKDLCCAGSNANQDLLGDLWAQFLSTTDVNSVLSQQPIYTYAVNVYAPGTSTNTQTFNTQKKLLESIGSKGGTGTAGYYQVDGNLRKMIEGLKDIFLTISAKNSVFASSSLPVSVNTQGTYLNQVFMGMFRPDADAYRRWNGNLKQYKINQNSAGFLYLADASSAPEVDGQTGAPAIDNANTGFLRQCAASFWTGDTSNWPVSGSAYWERVPVAQTPASECETPPAIGATTTFSLKSDWPDGPTVEKGGAGQWLRKRTCGPGETPTYCGRQIKTCASTSACDTNSDIRNFVSGTSGVPTSTLSAAIVNWVAGGNLGDGPQNSTTGNYQFYNGTTQTPPADGLTGGASYARPTVHGDVVHSRPLVINYGTGSANDVVAFYGSGDGMLRAIDGNRPPSPNTTTAGQELWAFVAPEFFTKFSRQRENSPKISYPTVSGPPTPEPKDYFFDGGIGAYQVRNSSGAVTSVWLYPSMRRGGRMIYAFDATTRPLGNDATAPTLKWRFGCPNADNDTGCVGGTDAAKIGQTWSTPRVIRLKGISNTYVVFGGGYDKCEDDNNQISGTNRCASSTKGQGVFVINADTGHNSTNGGSINYIDLTSVFSGAGRVAADVVPVDVNFDGYTDVIYVVDTRGNLYRINTSSGNSYDGINPSGWAAKTSRIAYFSNFADATEARKLMYAPDVVSLGSVNVVLLGSGDREHPIAEATATTPPTLANTPQAARVKNRFYGLYDNLADLTSGGSANLIDGSTPAASCTTPPTWTSGTCDLVDVTTTGTDYSVPLQTAKGWFINLSTYGSTGTQEQVVTTPATVGGTTYFSTFQPTNPNTAAQQCSNLGTARGYSVNFLTGGLAPNDSTRYAEFKGGGFAPSPVAGVVQLDNGKLVPFILGGKGLSPLEAGKPPLAVPGVRKPIYRFKKIDAK